VESDRFQLRRSLKETLFRKVKECLQNGLLAELKAEDDVDCVREYARGRAERQLKHDFHPYDDGENALLWDVPGEHCRHGNASLINCSVSMTFSRKEDRQ